jgi:NAD(P)-dependent dehydrogenase (short-subunit alcohol dehydrogenase family)
MGSQTSVDLQGKTVVVTGASAGIGAAAAGQLAQRGATVVVVGRSPEKTAAVARSIGVQPLVADFARLDDVRRLAADLLERCPRIDVLANNAGGAFPHRTTTVDGHELMFQVNHLAPFLLTMLLHDRLAETPGARVINTASDGNRMGSVDLTDLDWERRRWMGLRAYGTTKLENILFAREIARRWAGDGIVAAAFHPGIVASDFGREGLVTGLVYRSPLRRLLVSSSDSAQALVELAGRPDIAAFNGAYFNRHKPNARANKQADDAALASALWDRSAQLLGLEAVPAAASAA